MAEQEGPHLSQPGTATADVGYGLRRAADDL